MSYDSLKVSHCNDNHSNAAAAKWHLGVLPYVLLHVPPPLDSAMCVMTRPEYAMWSAADSAERKRARAMPLRALGRAPPGTDILLAYSVATASSSFRPCSPMLPNDPIAKVASL